MKWKTSISNKKDGDVYIRAHALKDLMEHHTFPDAIFLLLRGRLPTNEESRLFNAVLVSSIEHGVEPPSAFVARSVASVGNATNTAIAAGVLAVGEHHGGAGERVAELLQSDTSASDSVAHAQSEKRFLPGLGHPVYKDSDPRAETLFALAGTLGLRGDGYVKMRALQEELEKQSGKKLPVNIDGAHAAILTDMGFDWRLVKSLFILSRLPGIIAHVHEELINEKPYRRIDPDDVEYIV